MFGYVAIHEMHATQLLFYSQAAMCAAGVEVNRTDTEWNGPEGPSRRKVFTQI